MRQRLIFGSPLFQRWLAQAHLNAMVRSASWFLNQGLQVMQKNEQKTSSNPTKYACFAMIL